MEVQYIGGFGTSMFSDKLTFIAAQLVPHEPGTPFGGGYYAGKIMVDGQAYALVVAPKSQGGEATLRVKTSSTVTPGTGSENDGWSNTLAMIQAGSAAHPAAAFCRGLNINGYNDWYLPSLYEVEILYRAFKPTTLVNTTLGYGANPYAIPPTGNYTAGNPPQTNVDVFKSGGAEAFIADAYWSSTQNATTASGWVQAFMDGSQLGIVGKNMLHYVRAVRRVAI